jgi:hypothetical protein
LKKYASGDRRGEYVGIDQQTTLDDMSLTDNEVSWRSKIVTHAYGLMKQDIHLVANVFTTLILYLVCEQNCAIGLVQPPPTELHSELLTTESWRLAIQLNPIFGERSNMMTSVLSKQGDGQRSPFQKSRGVVVTGSSSSR